MSRDDVGVAPSVSLADAAALADGGRWAAARDAYAAVLAREETADAHRGLSRACWWLGETGRARDHAERAFAAYEAAGRYGDATMTGVHLGLWFLTNFDNEAAAAGWFSRARHLATLSGDDAVQGWVTLVSGYTAPDPREGLRLLEEAATTAQSLSDPDLATMALADLGLWHVTAGAVDRGMAMLDEAMAATFAQPRRMLEVVVWSSCDMLAACSLVEDLRRAAEWCRAADRFMETYGCPFLQVRCRTHYGEVLVAAGHWPEAEHELEQALSMSTDSGHGPRTEALTALATLRRRQGSPEAALELLDGADPTSAGALVRAACLLDLGRAGEAREVLRAEVALSTPDRPDHPALAATLAEAELAAGRVEEAARLVGLNRTGEIDRAERTAPAYPRAAALRARAAGLVATALGDLPAARRHLAHALDAFTRLELPFEAALTELDLARLLQETDREAAVGRARSAHARLQQLGARHHLGEAGLLLRSLGVTPPPGPRSADTLSARERDVLALLAEGLTNPDIARRLFLSPRTVGHHVSSILRKLGLRSRTEAAACAARAGALDRGSRQSSAR